MTSIPPGRPAWVDLFTSDPAAAAGFYAPLFGWAVAEATGEPPTGRLVFHQQGRPVAGAGPTDDGQPAWTPYLATENVDTACQLATATGGRLRSGPVEVSDSRRSAVLTDPAGASFGVWQSLGLSGAEVFDVPGALTWAELTTREPDRAKEFYGAVFGWTADDQPMDAITYTTWQRDGQQVAGMMPMVGEEWGDLPSHWMVYFAVTDTDAVADEAQRLGGSVSVPPTDLPRGRFAVLTDPQGAFFSILGPVPAPA
ncbi:VOC family protein [Verrucosispora sp. WMMA2044]|uniref:VOC family protein n=1 Tax=Verrucosispora sp. WMMA2044 TaxID=3016419 RepID=UPI00248B6D84|nr:VOC family protein [Verrucosispora sp. WMMA2044]WBB48024.1 VOC family protein [Verrucosispora sp. WMMA2044]